MLCEIEQHDVNRLELIVQEALKALGKINSVGRSRSELIDVDDDDDDDDDGSSVVGETDSDDIEIRTGETRGPFAIKHADAGSDGENQLSLSDLTGEVHRFELDGADELLRRLAPCQSPLFANCVVVLIDDCVQLLFTKDVRRKEPLLGVLIVQNPSAAVPPPSDHSVDKRFVCPRCHVAKFGNLKNLQVHQQVYCARRDIPAATLAASTTLTTPTNAFSPGFVDQNGIILLPLAYHSLPQTQIVQLLGPPQTMIPVAIGRPSAPHPTLPIHPLSAPTTKPLIVSSQLCAAMTCPSELKFALRDFNVTIPIERVDDKKPIKANLATMLNMNLMANPLDLSGCRKRMHTEKPPLPPTSSTPSTSTSTNKRSTTTSEAEKQFTCSCGVAFTADATLRAHQQFYCKNALRSNNEAKETARKMPTRCTQCDFSPLSASQLSLHMRSAHHNVKAYICSTCGYRGFSLRGIRTHLRTHPELDAVKFDVLLDKHVSKVTGDDQGDKRPK